VTPTASVAISSDRSARIPGVGLSGCSGVRMEQFFSDPERVTVIGILGLIIIGGWRGWYVWAWQFRAEVHEKEYWRTAALRSTALAETAVEPRKGDG